RSHGRWGVREAGGAVRTGERPLPAITRSGRYPEMSHKTAAASPCSGHGDAAAGGSTCAICYDGGIASGTAGGGRNGPGGGGVGLHLPMVPLVQVHKDHSVPDGTSHGLRSTPGPPQAPVRPYVAVLVPRDDDRLTEHG